MKRIVTIGLAVMLLGAGCASTTPSSTSNRATLTLPDGKEVNVEVARTPDQQAQGLADRTDVGDGMLFCMGETTMQRFWMLGMKVPIDMVWVHGGEVRGVSAEVPLREAGNNDKSAPTVRSSPEPVNMVLELPSGWAAKHNVEAGTMIDGSVEACK